MYCRVLSYCFFICFFMFSHYSLCCSKVKWFLRSKQPTSHTILGQKYTALYNSLSCVLAPAWLLCNSDVAVQISQENEMPCAVCGSLFMLAVVLTNTAILNLDHLSAGIVLLLWVFGPCWGAVTAFKWAFCFSENEEFLSASTHRGWLEQNVYPSWLEIATAPDNMLVIEGRNILNSNGAARWIAWNRL